MCHNRVKLQPSSSSNRSLFLVNFKEKPPSNASHPFSVNNLMMAGNSFSNPYQNPFNAAGFAAAAAAQLHRQSLYNSALYSSELAHHFASWWPTVAAAGVYGAHQNPFASFTAAAALSRFNPSLFLPPQSPSAGLNPSSSSSSSSSASNHMAASSPFSLSSNRSTSSTSSSSSHHQKSNHSNSNGHHSDQMKGQQYPPGHMKKKARMDDGRPVNMSHNQHHSHQHGNGSQHGHHNGHHNGHGGMMGGPEAMHKHMQSMLQTPPPQMSEPKSKKPHVKKPLNAFMLFMKEQRAQVVSECTLRESAAINQILGRKWHELDKAEQSKYYEMARQERLNHIKMHPDWSARDNYGIKKKGKRKREKIIGDNSDLPRKCRARFGVHQINLWCKPCRRKKKCIRFSCQDDQKSGGSGANAGQMMYNGGNFSNGSSIGEGSSGGVGSGANSLNGANSDEEYEDDSGDDDDVSGDEEDDMDDDLEDGDEDRTHTEDDLENKSHHMNSTNMKTPTNQNHQSQRHLNTSGRTKSLQNSNKLNHHPAMKPGEFDLAGMSNMMASFGANGMLPNLLPGGHNMFYNEINNQLSHHLQQQAFHFNAQ